MALCGSGLLRAATKSSERPSVLSFVFVLHLLITFAFADCECGYAASIGPSLDTVEHVFTDLIETDFSHLRDVATNTDWQRQAFNLSHERARGAFGEMFAVENIASNPNTNTELEVGKGKDGEDAGLRLVVKSDTVNDMVPVAEIDTMRLDVLYGTYRAGLKITDVPGTCSAFFWYFNDTQEIDMEFLSKDFNPENNTFPVNLVLQSREAAESGFDAQQTRTFVRANLPFNPTLEFHEYRIDFLPGQVFFYADNVMLARMNSSAVPEHAGHLVLQHWSNGNPLWSGGPPDRDAAMSVAYVKAYFNSSEARRQQDWQQRCTDPGAQGAVCRIPESTATNLSAREFFFSAHPQMVPNQTVSKNGGNQVSGGLHWPMLIVVLILQGRMFGVW